MTIHLVNKTNTNDRTPGERNTNDHTPGERNTNDHTPGERNTNDHTPGERNTNDHTPGERNKWKQDFTTFFLDSIALICQNVIPMGHLLKITDDFFFICIFYSKITLLCT